MVDYNALAEPWVKMVEAIDRCCDTAKLTAFHCSEAGKYARKAGIEASLTAFYVTEYLKERRLKN